MTITIDIYRGMIRDYFKRRKFHKAWPERYRKWTYEMSGEEKATMWRIVLAIPPGYMGLDRVEKMNEIGIPTTFENLKKLSDYSRIQWKERGVGA
jgi:hypothetical protein